MWICKCGKKNVDSEDSCWSCGIGRTAAELTKDKQLQPRVEEPEGHETETDYTSAYNSTRLIAQFVSFVGWVLVIIGTLGFVLILAMGFLSYRVPDLTELLSCLAGVMGGLFLVLVGQLTRATADTADNTGEMLSMMKKRKSR